VRGFLYLYGAEEHSNLLKYYALATGKYQRPKCPYFFHPQGTSSLIVENDDYHHKHPGLGHLARSVSTVTVALSKVSSVFQLFSFLVGYTGVILKGFGLVTFFAGIKAFSFCIHLSCLVCILSVVRGVWSRLFYDH
jgi:hypothetical protein